MKQLLFFVFMFFLSATVFAQSLSEGFESTPVKNVPGDWIVSSNTEVTVYSRPKACGASENGLLTPGVGQSAPVRMILPLLTFNGVISNYQFSFYISVLDPNLDCSSAKNFNCNTFVKAYLVAESWFTINSKSYVLNSKNFPPQSLIYAEKPDYQIFNANGYNTITFNVNPATVNGKKFRILLDFKSAENSNCTERGTKFVFDDFKLNALCSNCAPIANDDYFDATLQSFTNTVKGNLFGGNMQWLNEIASAGYSSYLLNSLASSPAINRGVDIDPAGTPLSYMQYSLIPGSITVNGSCSPASVSLTINPNGTFTLSRGTDACIKQVSFRYQLTNMFTTLFTTAKVIVTFPSSTLPVSFKSFNATRNKETVILKWETASEVNNRGFYVQRNTDGSWKDITFVSSAAIGGNSSSLLAYQATDLNVTPGVSQYRIQQIDLDGKSRYSDVRVVRGDQQTAKLMVFPNPSNNGKVTVLFDDQTSVKDVMVSNMTGHIVKQWTGISNSNLTIEDLQNGIYTIQVINRTTATTMMEKFIIQKR
ncbi:MAG: T9SS type A sorting domain-containing protein [Bacteroidota bacterium]|nr:T9SS type A sorting domain-containing protein [Bacteroidota bacterium]